MPLISFKTYLTEIFNKTLPIIKKSVAEDKICNTLASLPEDMSVRVPTKELLSYAEKYDNEFIYETDTTEIHGFNAKEFIYFLRVENIFYIFRIIFTNYSREVMTTINPITYEKHKIKFPYFLMNIGFEFEGKIDITEKTYHSVKTEKLQGFDDTTIGMKVYAAVGFLTTNIIEAYKEATNQFVYFSGDVERKAKIYAVFCRLIMSRFHMVDLRDISLLRKIKDKFPSIYKTFTELDMTFGYVFKPERDFLLYYEKNLPALEQQLKTIFRGYGKRKKLL